MEADAETKRAAALAFLKDHSAGVLATVSREGKPHASIVYYASDDSFPIPRCFASVHSPYTLVGNG